MPAAPGFSPFCSTVAALAYCVTAMPCSAESAQVPSSTSSQGIRVWYRGSEGCPEGETFIAQLQRGFQILASSSWGTETRMSLDGSVVLGSLVSERPDEHAAFRWTEATGAVEITPGVASTGTDISDGGSVVVATSWEDAQFEDAWPEATFVWDTTHGTRDLQDVLAARGADTTGWEFGHARALSGDGKVLLGRARRGGVPTLYRMVLSD